MLKGIKKKERPILTDESLNNDYNIIINIITVATVY